MPALNENIRALISSTKIIKITKIHTSHRSHVHMYFFLARTKKALHKNNSAVFIFYFIPMYLGPLGFLLMGQCKCYMLMQQQGTERSCILCVSLLLSCMLKIIRNNKKLLRILRQHNIKPSMGLV